jgi:hypothetical protein
MADDWGRGGLSFAQITRLCWLMSSILAPWLMPWPGWFAGLYLVRCW